MRWKGRKFILPGQYTNPSICFGRKSKLKFSSTLSETQFKNGFLEFKRTLHPNAVIPVRYNSKSVPLEIVFNILAFFILYMLSFIIGALVFSMFQIDFESSVGLAASSLGNVGPALGEFGPVNNYSALPPLAKWWGAFLMLIGRLELFTVLILLTPFFWRNR